jgi:uncharacterized membrane protein HdeD (DUF308 family)
MSTLFDTIASTVKNWWWFIIKGLLFLVAGIAVFSRPVEGYVGLSLLFTVVMIGSGFSQIFFSISNSSILPGWGWTLVSGFIDLAIGIYLAIYPLVTLATLPLILGFWLIFGSFYLMGAAFHLKDLGLEGWGWLLFGGILVLFFGFGMLYYPATGVISIVVFSGMAFLAAGVFNILLAIKFKSIKSKVNNLIK